MSLFSTGWQDAVGATGFRMGDLRGLWKVEIE